MGIFSTLKQKINIFSKIKDFFNINKNVLGENYISELENILIQSDLSYKITHQIIESLKKNLSNLNKAESEQIYSELKKILKSYLKEGNLSYTGKTVILVIGINGVGKTTTIGKLANLLKKDKKNVIIGAADTFRAAASDQLEIWAQRASVEIIKGNYNSDPASVIYETLKKENYDVALIDTAGRLHNKENLMRELKKIDKIIEKYKVDNYVKLLVLDATLGQDSLSQAKTFAEFVNIDGFIITKLDSTSKGGVIFEIFDQLNKPVYFIGIGEGIDDLKVFDSESFINNIF